MLNLAVMVSGGGTNLQAVLDAAASGALRGARPVLVISSRPDAYALTRAARAGVPTFVADRARFPDETARTAETERILKAAGVDLIVLAGYMSILPPALTDAFRGRIINIHPSLIPKHCGRGFYGERVHRAVLEAGDGESGATVHYVDEGVDTGSIILQERVPVYESDDVSGLAARVLAVEHKILVEAINTVAETLTRRDT